MLKILKQTLITYALFSALFFAQSVTIYYCMINSPGQMKTLALYMVFIGLGGLLCSLIILFFRTIPIDRYIEKFNSKSGLTDKELVSAISKSQSLPFFASVLYFIYWNGVNLFTFISFKMEES